MAALIVAIIIGIVLLASRARPKVEAPEAVAPKVVAPVGGFEWEMKDAIAAGLIPPPPRDIDMITTVAWYWDGKGWITKTRPGFEPIRLEEGKLKTFIG